MSFTIQTRGFKKFGKNMTNTRKSLLSSRSINSTKLEKHTQRNPLQRGVSVTNTKGAEKQSSVIHCSVETPEKFWISTIAWKPENDKSHYLPTGV